MLVIPLGIPRCAPITAIRTYRNTARKKPIDFGPRTEIHRRLVIVGLHSIFHIRVRIISAYARIEQLRRVPQRQIFADLVIPGNILYARLIMIQRHETHLIFITEIGIGIETEFLVAFERHVIKYPQRSVPLAIDIHRSTGTTSVGIIYRLLHDTVLRRTTVDTDRKRLIGIDVIRVVPQPHSMTELRFQVGITDIYVQRVGNIGGRL